MWRLYCPGNNGVAIQTSYNKLVKSVENDPSIFIGKVTYIDYEFQGFPQGNFLYPVMHKRISFAHEQEVRLVTTKTPENWGTPQEVNPLGILFDWPLDMVVEAIHVDPYAPVYFHDVVNSVIRRVLPSLEDRVFWSKMRASPVYWRCNIQNGLAQGYIKCLTLHSTRTSAIKPRQPVNSHVEHKLWHRMNKPRWQLCLNLGS